jgi:hypothetical protein
MDDVVYTEHGSAAGTRLHSTPLFLIHTPARPDKFPSFIHPSHHEVSNYSSFTDGEQTEASFTEMKLVAVQRPMLPN